MKTIPNQNQAITAQPPATPSGHAIPTPRAIAFAIVLGIGLVAVIGFAGGDMLHNAAHDLRHASGFPCH